MTFHNLIVEQCLQTYKLGQLADNLDLADAYDLTHAGPNSSFPDELLVLVKFLISGSGHSCLNLTGSESPAPRIIGDIAHLLRKVVVTRQEDYATTLIEDQALLQDSSIGARRRMAIEVRLGEKMILKEALDELERLDLCSTPGSNHSIGIVSTKRKVEQDGMLGSKKRRGA